MDKTKKLSLWALLVGAWRAWRASPAGAAEAIRTRAAPSPAARPFAEAEFDARARDGFLPGDVDRLAATVMMGRNANAGLHNLVNEMRAILAAMATNNKFGPLRISVAALTRLPAKYEVSWVFTDKRDNPVNKMELAAHLLIQVHVPQEAPKILGPDGQPSPFNSR